MPISHCLPADVLVVGPLTERPLEPRNGEISSIEGGFEARILI